MASNRKRPAVFTVGPFHFGAAKVVTFFEIPKKMKKLSCRLLLAQTMKTSQSPNNIR